MWAEVLRRHQEAVCCVSPGFLKPWRLIRFAITGVCECHSAPEYPAVGPEHTPHMGTPARATAPPAPASEATHEVLCPNAYTTRSEAWPLRQALSIGERYHTPYQFF